MVSVHFPHSRRNLLRLLTGRAVGSVTGLGIAARTDGRTTHPRDSPRKSKPRPNMAAPAGRRRGAPGHVAAPSPTWPLADAPRVPRRVPSPPQPCGPDPKMAAPSERRNGGGAWAVLLLAAVALRPAEAVSEPTTVAFDVRPGGVVHSFSQNVGPGDKYTCAFTYASQGGTNEKWQMSLGTSEDHQHFTCTIWRPQGKSYLYFTQFKAEVRGAEIEYGMAYSKAAFERESDVPLKSDEFEVTKTAVSHRPGAFKAELSKLVIVAKASRSEL